jgi:hypothetical protein
VVHQISPSGSSRSHMVLGFHMLHMGLEICNETGAITLSASKPATQPNVSTFLATSNIPNAFGEYLLTRAFSIYCTGQFGVASHARYPPRGLPTNGAFSETFVPMGRTTEANVLSTSSIGTRDKSRMSRKDPRKYKRNPGSKFKPLDRGATEGSKQKT